MNEKLKIETKVWTNPELRDYEVLPSGVCSCCGEDAEWTPLDDWNGFFDCVACSSFNDHIFYDEQI